MELGELRLKFGKTTDAKIRNCHGFRGMCPAHADDNPSFAAWEGEDGFIHFNCKAGCTEEAILTALGMSQNDRRITPIENTDNPGKRATYTYTDKNGNYLFEKVRFVGKNGKKSFTLQVRFLNGKPIKGTINEFGYHVYPTPQEIGIAQKTNNLYNLPAVCNAAKTGGRVYFCNGEKAADALIKQFGVCATCLVHGESSPWHSAYTDGLRGVQLVTVIAQRDRPGCAHAAMICTELVKGGIPVEAVNCAVPGEKTDGFDHVEAGFGLDDFIPRRDLLPSADVRGYEWASEITPQEVKWLAEPYFPFGMLCGIEGDPGIGKSFLCAALAGAASLGLKLPVFNNQIPKIKVLLYATEDATEYTTVPRLIQFGSDLANIAIVDEVIPLDYNGLSDMRAKIMATGAKLVVIDPITAFIDSAQSRGTNISTHAVMDGMKNIAAETGACIICLRHLRKDSQKDGQNPIYSGVGSIGIIGKYRSCVQIKWDKDIRGRCNVYHIKCNVGPLGPSFGYQIYRNMDGSASFEWIKEPESHWEGRELPNDENAMYEDE